MAKRPTGLFGNLTQKMVPIIGNWVVPFEEIRWYPFRKLAGTLSGNSAPRGCKSVPIEILDAEF